MNMDKNIYYEKNNNKLKFLFDYWLLDLMKKHHINDASRYTNLNYFIPGGWVECTNKQKISIPDSIDPETQVKHLEG